MIKKLIADSIVFIAYFAMFYYIGGEKNYFFAFLGAMLITTILDLKYILEGISNKLDDAIYTNDDDDDETDECNGCRCEGQCKNS